MEIANIATAKNHLSQLIEKVKQGQSIVITDRKRPVAVLEPYTDTSSTIQELQLSGVLSPSRSRLDVKAFLDMPLAALPPKSSLSSAILAEREDSR